MLVGVKFKPVSDAEYFECNNLELKENENVICDTENGLMFGTVVELNHQRDAETEYKRVVRIATKNDVEKLAEIEKKDKEALKISKNLAKKHGVEMKLIDVDYSFDYSKLTISFTADGRVDFRELLKSLASEFKTRIELKQVGARDETKILGGYGPCGRQLCCANHLKDFGKVGIKMAKDQNLALNPSSINGVCNRLLCCLQYEENDYLSALQNMPKLNSKVQTPDGEGVVTFNNVLKNEVSVKFLNDNGGYTIRDYALGEIKFEKKVEE